MLYPLACATHETQSLSSYIIHRAVLFPARRILLLATANGAARNAEMQGATDEDDVSPRFG